MVSDGVGCALHRKQRGTVHAVVCIRGTPPVNTWACGVNAPDAQHRAGHLGPRSRWGSSPSQWNSIDSAERGRYGQEPGSHVDVIVSRAGAGIGSQPPAVRAFLLRAHAEPAFAAEIAHVRAHGRRATVRHERLGRSGTGPTRYSATGEVVTRGSEARYKAVAATRGRASISLYNAEKAKGTDPADIFDELIALVDSQPEDFRSFIDWEGKTG
jgi:hypothetical protein